MGWKGGGVATGEVAERDIAEGTQEEHEWGGRGGLGEDTAVGGAAELAGGVLLGNAHSASGL